jgi:DNA-3-methyladenine glycosylase II
MFLMFCLRRPDVLPVGDLGVQKGLIRWVLAAHDALPASKKKRKGNPEFAADLDNVDQVDPHGDGEIDTLVQPTSTPPPVDRPGRPLTPITPNTSGRVNATLHTPGAPHAPPTPVTPAETIEVPSKQLLPPAPETFLAPVKADPAWDAHRIAPLSEGLTIESLKTRLSGKKVK